MTMRHKETTETQRSPEILQRSYDFENKDIYLFQKHFILPFQEKSQFKIEELTGIF